MATRPQAKKRRRVPLDLSLSQTQADFLFALVTLQNQSGDGVTAEALAEKMQSLGHSTYRSNSTMIPRLVHELRKERKIPIVSLPALRPEGRVVRGYGLANFKQVTLPRTAHFLMACREFPNDKDRGRAVEKHVGDFKEHLRTQGFDDASIEDDLRFTLDQGYLMGFPNKTNPTHLRLRNRLAYELRYLISLAHSYSSLGAVASTEMSIGNEVQALSELEAQVLFTVWDMERATNKPPAFESIRTAMSLSKPKLEKICHRLHSFPWSVMTTFRSENSRMFRIAHDHVVGWPRTAALLVLIGDGEYHEDEGIAFQFRRRRFIDFARLRLRADFDVDSDLLFAAKNHYIKLKGDHKECFWPDDRLYAELPFLKLISDQYKPISLFHALSERHAQVLIVNCKKLYSTDEAFTLFPSSVVNRFRAGEKSPGSR